jgi:hypothetical protein
VTSLRFEALGLLDIGVFLRSLRQVDHPGAMQCRHCFLGIILKVLANDQDGFAVIVTIRVRESNIGRERNCLASVENGLFRNLG